MTELSHPFWLTVEEGAAEAGEAVDNGRNAVDAQIIGLTVLPSATDA